MAPKRRKLDEGPKLADHELMQGKEQQFGEHLRKYGQYQTFTRSFTKCIDDALSSLARCKVPKEKGEGLRDMWLCADCGWIDFTYGADRALYHKLGNMNQAAWLDSGEVRPRRTQEDMTAEIKDRIKKLQSRLGGGHRCRPCTSLLSNEKVVDLAAGGVRAAVQYVKFQGWTAEEPPKVGVDSFNLQQCRELHVLEIVETHSSFQRIKNPRTKQLLQMMSGGQYSINRAEFSAILRNLYDECVQASLDMARSAPGTLSFDGQFSQGHNMINLWVSNGTGRLHMATEDFSYKKQDAAEMCAFVLAAMGRIGDHAVAAVVTDRPSVMLKARRLLLQEKPDAVWAFCLEHGGHLIAKRLEKIFPWIKSASKDSRLCKSPGICPKGLT